MSRISAESVLLLGPTAGGKSALALALAERLPLEIVSIDSAQVYRGMDIGTAKPTAAERARVPHHLLDLRDPDQTYSAADFVCDATRAMADIRARGKLPLIVGGTMLYAKALREGLSALPPADTGVRARLLHEAQALGWPALHARLAQLDALTAARLAPNDSQRIQRALEVFELTGTPLSQLHAGTRADAVRFPIVALLPADRDVLRERIATRFTAMLAAGFLDEVRALRARYRLHRDLPSMRAVGYRQAWAHLEGETTHDEFVATAVTATRGLAKRQMTWLRSMRDAQTVDPDRPDALDTLTAVVHALRVAT
jgi:tRNA dimethylallyltransferase